MPKRTDVNQKGIVRDLRIIGASVQPTHTVGKGFPDIVVGLRGDNYLFEIKRDENAKLTPAERRWHDSWRGQVDVIYSTEDALRVMGLYSGKGGRITVREPRDKKLLRKYLQPGETWGALCKRVASICPECEDEVFSDLISLRFLPNSPTLVNGRRFTNRNLAACHVIHVENSISGILDAVKWSGLVFKSGGGIGLEFSDLSPYGTPLKYAPGGIASGPVSFMRIFDVVGEVIQEGGLRRAAIMGVMNAKH